MPTSKRTVTSLRLPQASRLGRRTSGCARGPLCRSQDKVHSHPFRKPSTPRFPSRHTARTSPPRSNAAAACCAASSPACR